MDKRRIRSLDFTYQDIDQAINDGDGQSAMDMLNTWLWEHPEDPRALYQLGNMFYDAGRFPLAYHMFKKSISIEPISSESWEGLGLCQDLLNQHEEAVKSYARAYRIKEDPKQFANMARAYGNMRNPEKAKKFAMEALRHNPNDKSSKFTLGLAQLFEKDSFGWVNYFEGRGCQQREVRNYIGEPEWNGEPGKKIVIYGEQGMGDEICFSSAIPDAMKDCEVILDISPRLVKLYERSFPNVEIHGTRFNKEMTWEPPKIDASILMSGLFKYYRTEGYPGTPFLKADAEKVKSIRKRHSKGKKLIGIAWSGGMPATKRTDRTINLDMLAPIYTQDATFISLEYVPKDLTGYPIRYTEEAWSDDMDDVAALVAACDLIISVPTTVVHLAGALGVPCIALVHEKPTVFYGLSGGLDIWDSVDIIRKKNTWESAIIDAAQELEKRLEKKVAA